MARRSIRAGHAVALAAGLVIGGTLITLVFFDVAWDGGPVFTPRFDLGAFVRTLPEHRRWLVPFFLVALTLPAWRALVWRVVAPPPRPRYLDAYHATALGALVHNTIPGKLGPLAAAWTLSRTSREPFAAALSSQLVAKLLELGAVVALGAVASAFVPRADGLGRAIVFGAAAFVALATIAVTVGLAAPRAGLRVSRRLPRVGAALCALGDGIRGVGTLARLLLALGVALGPALTAAAAYAIPLAAFGAEVGLAGGAVLVAVITFGQLTPGLPVGAGLYWGLSAWAARRLGAAADDAAALAVVTHVGMVAASLVAGGVSAVARRTALLELLRRRREVARLAAEAERAARTGSPGPPPEATAVARSRAPT